MRMIGRWPKKNNFCRQSRIVCALVAVILVAQSAIAFEADTPVTPNSSREARLHLAHGVRNTAAGMRYVLYVFLCDLKEPSRLIHAPGGYFMAPENDERVGDVSNVVFANGWVARANGDVFIYYGSSDTRTHVATTTVEKLLDYCRNTPPDGRRSKVCVEQRCKLIEKNLRLRGK
jgi:4-O-beta-D-mannosyl-D-glucose phosphorylase